MQRGFSLFAFESGTNDRCHTTVSIFATLHILVIFLLFSFVVVFLFFQSTWLLFSIVIFLPHLNIILLFFSHVEARSLFAANGDKANVVQPRLETSLTHFSPFFFALLVSSFVAHIRTLFPIDSYQIFFSTLTQLHSRIFFSRSMKKKKKIRIVSRLETSPDGKISQLLSQVR